MIVRVFEARLVAGAERAYEAAPRDDIDDARRQVGLVSIRWGQRIERDATHVIVVSEWRDLEDVKVWLGLRYLQPRFAPGEDALVLEARVRHYEGLEP